MQLAFIYQPVKNLKEALDFYREQLGLEAAWREGEEAAALKLPGTDVQIMLDQDEREDKAGPFFVVDDVVAFYETNQDRLDFLWAPRRIPPGMYTAFTDPSGNVIRLMDTSADR